MALATIGGGYQFTDGNQNELPMGTQVAPQTATVTATLSAAQVAGGLLVATPGAATASYTFPTGTSLDAQMGNMKVNSTFALTIINLTAATGVITMVAGAGTGISTVGSLTVALSSSAQYLFRKTDTAAYSVYRVS